MDNINEKLSKMRELQYEFGSKMAALLLDDEADKSVEFITLKKCVLRALREFDTTMCYVESKLTKY